MLAPVTAFLIQKGWTGNVQMHPRVIGKMLQKLGRGDGPGFSAPDILEVRDRGPNHIPVFVPQRQRHKALVGGHAGLQQGRNQPRIGRPHAGGALTTQGHDSGTCQRSQIQDQRRLETLGIMQGIRQN